MKVKDLIKHLQDPINFDGANIKEIMEMPVKFATDFDTSYDVLSIYAARKKVWIDIG